MKKLRWLILAIPFLLVQGEPQAQDSFMSVGVMVGESSGFTIQMWDLGSDEHSYEAAVAWSREGGDGIQVQGARRWHFHELEDGYFLVGYGARIKFEGLTHLGARVPIGFNFVIPGGTWEVFIEVAPILDITPEIEFAANWSVGTRRYL